MCCKCEHRDLNGSSFSMASVSVSPSLWSLVSFIPAILLSLLDEALLSLQILFPKKFLACACAALHIFIFLTNAINYTNTFSTQVFRLLYRKTRIGNYFLTQVLVT